MLEQLLPSMATIRFKGATNSRVIAPIQNVSAEKKKNTVKDVSLNNSDAEDLGASQVEITHSNKIKKYAASWK